MTEFEKKFAHVKTVKSKSWEIRNLIIEDLKSGKAKLLSLDDRILMHSIRTVDLTDVKSWSTFDQCMNFKFTYSPNFITCEARIYDGDSYHGYPQGLRFSAEIQLPSIFTKYLCNSIDAQFDRTLDQEHEDYLEQQKQRWIRARTKKILASAKVEEHV